MSRPGSQGCDIDLSSANVLDILLAYRAFRQTLNVGYSNDNIVRKIRQLEKEFSCTLVPAQITDIFYANFIQWAHEGGNCHIAHFDVSKVERRPQYRKTLERVRDMFVLLCNLGQRYSDIVRISPENFERNMFRIIRKKTGNKPHRAEDIHLVQCDEVPDGGGGEEMFRAQVREDLRTVYHFRRGLNGAGQPASFSQHQSYDCSNCLLIWPGASNN